MENLKEKNIKKERQSFFVFSSVLLLLPFVFCLGKIQILFSDGLLCLTPHAAAAVVALCECAVSSRATAASTARHSTSLYLSLRSWKFGALLLAEPRGEGGARETQGRSRLADAARGK